MAGNSEQSVIGQGPSVPQSVRPVDGRISDGVLAIHQSQGDFYPDAWGDRESAMLSKHRNDVCKASNTEEPGAVISHAGICEGVVGKLAVLP